MSTQVEITFNRICQQAAEKRASEIYLIPAQLPFIRIHGKMQSLAKENILATSFIKSLINALLSEDEQKELQQNKQITILKEISRLGNSQINIYFSKGAPSLRIKLLAQEIVDFPKLEVPEMISKILSAKRGIIFVTGPRDSGRSTLVMSMLNNINKHEVKFIATVEKPIRAILNGVKSVIEQREVGRDVNSFLQGLSYIRDRNVDVVMVSRVRDAEVLKELFAISESGSLVFAIMDTGAAIKTIKRALHFFPRNEEENIRYFLSENLAGIISCRLVPKIGGGRIWAFEILPGTPAVKSILAAGKLYQLAGTLQASEDRTAISLDQSLADLVSVGKIMTEQALKYCSDEEVFRSLLRR